MQLRIRSQGVNVPEIVNGFDLSIRNEMASQVGPAGIDIAYQRLGKSDAPAVLLIMGISAQSIHWPDSFCLRSPTAACKSSVSTIEIPASPHT
jgi:hypothetical protein